MCPDAQNLGKSRGRGQPGLAISGPLRCISADERAFTGRPGGSGDFRSRRRSRSWFPQLVARVVVVFTSAPERSSRQPPSFDTFCASRLNRRASMRGPVAIVAALCAGLALAQTPAAAAPAAANTLPAAGEGAGLSGPSSSPQAAGYTCDPNTCKLPRCSASHGNGCPPTSQIARVPRRPAASRPRRRQCSSPVRGSDCEPC